MTKFKITKHGNYVNIETSAGGVKLNGKEIIDNHPVGTVYISVNSTSPASLFGGSWTSLASNVTLPLGDTAAVSVVGSGKALQISTGSLKLSLLAGSYSGNTNYLRLGSPADADIGGALSVPSSYGRDFALGVVTSGETGLKGTANLASALSAIKVYVWKRTA